MALLPLQQGLPGVHGVAHEGVSEDEAMGEQVRACDPSSRRVLGSGEERLAAGAFTKVEPGNQIGLLQEAMEIAEQVKPLERRVFDARRAGDIQADDIPGQIDEAEQKGILTPAEAEAVRVFDRRVLELTGVDDFDPSELRRESA